MSRVRELVFSHPRIYNFYLSSRIFPWIHNKYEENLVNYKFEKDLQLAKSRILTHQLVEYMGFKMDLDPSEGHDLLFAILKDKNQVYEEEIVQYIKESGQDHIVFVDVGANNGFYSLLVASMSLENTIYSFEPNPSAYARLIANINTNSFKNIHPYNIALGSTEGDSFLNVSGLEDGLSSLKSIKSTKTVVPVHISTLDKMLGLRKIDIIKIDVEGFEEEVMKGASQIIEYNQNIRIIFEHNKNFVNKSYDNGVSYLQSLGFNIYRIVPSSKTPLLRIPNKIGLLTSCNLLAVRGKPNRNHS